MMAEEVRPYPGVYRIIREALREGTCKSSRFTWGMTCISPLAWAREYMRRAHVSSRRLPEPTGNMENPGHDVSYPQSKQKMTKKVGYIDARSPLYKDV